MLKTELRSFHAVAVHGGFSSAAKVLNVSQSALSIQVKALEQRYSIELFNRRRRAVTLTLPGTELFKVTTRLTQIEGEAEDLLNSFMGLHSGTLRLAAVGPFHATDMIVVYKAKFPGIDINVQFGNSRRSFDRLLSYDADVAIIAEVTPDPRVSTLPYSTHEVVVFVNKDHPFHDRESISVRDLQNQDTVLREPGSTTRTAMTDTLIKHHVSINPVLELDSREGIWKAVEQGLGIGFVADFEFVPHPNLKAIRIRDAVIQTRYFLAYLSEREDSHLIKSFCSLALNKV